MKTWTQDMLPLKIIKDLGVLQASPTSRKKTRFIEFECPDCSKPFRATPSKVKSLTVQRCGPCGHGSRSPKADASGKKICTTCQETKPLTDYYKNNRRRDGYNTQCKSCLDAYKASWVKNDEVNIKNKRENSRLLKRYGISSDDYMKLLKDQDYTCAICNCTPEQGRGNTNRLSVDHCHETGKVRGLLCQKCNTGLGLLGDNKEGLQKALDYLGT